MKATGISDVRTETIAVLSQPQDQLVFTEQLLCTRPAGTEHIAAKGPPCHAEVTFYP